MKAARSLLNECATEVPSYLAQRGIGTFDGKGPPGACVPPCVVTPMNTVRNVVCDAGCAEARREQNSIISACVERKKREAAAEQSYSNPADTHN